jgi:hypothetical protein
VELGVPEPPPPPPLWEAELLPLTWFHDGPAGPLAYVVADVLGDLGFVVQIVVDASVRALYGSLGMRPLRESTTLGVSPLQAEAFRMMPGKLARFAKRPGKRPQPVRRPSRGTT